jgi:glycosyltransferase involved in cell wall biosynthesis
MTYPRISIITPSFNQGQFLEQTIQSVISQDYPNLEYIIIDGGSTDDSVSVIKKYEQHFAYWVSENDSGQSEAINKGIQKATGDVFNWINADDYYEPGALKKVAEIMKQDSVSFVAGKTRVFGNETRPVISEGTRIYQGNISKTIGWAVIDQPATFFRKKYIEDIGLFNPRLKYLMDREWWLKYLMQYGLRGAVQIPDILVSFRLHKNSKTVSQLSRFNEERDTIFYAIARCFKLDAEAEVIGNLSSIDQSYSFTPGIISLTKREQAESFNYYFLLLGNEYYYSMQKEKAEICFSMVDKHLLATGDKRLFQSLLLKHKFIPYPLRNIYKSF